jgi:hypothetical protein
VPAAPRTSVPCVRTPVRKRGSPPCDGSGSGCQARDMRKYSSRASRAQRCAAASSRAGRPEALAGWLRRAPPRPRYAAAGTRGSIVELHETVSLHNGASTFYSSDPKLRSACFIFQVTPISSIFPCYSNYVCKMDLPNQDVCSSATTCRKKTVCHTSSEYVFQQYGIGRSIQ